MSWVLNQETIKCTCFPSMSQPSHQDLSQSNDNSPKPVDLAARDDLQQLSNVLGFSIVKQEVLENKAKGEIEVKIAEANSIKEAKLKAKEEARKKALAKKKKRQISSDDEEEANTVDDTVTEAISNSENSQPQNTLYNLESTVNVDDLGIFSDNSEEAILFEDDSSLNSNQKLPNLIDLTNEDLINIFDSDAEDSEVISNKTSSSKGKSKVLISDSESEYVESDVPSEEEADSAITKNPNQTIDDLDQNSYRARFDAWIKARTSHRTSPIKIPEKDAPHPLYKDSILENDNKIPGEIFKDLMDYQKQGVKWLCDLFQWKQGGILADEMGLGKTIQAIAFLATLYYSKKLNKPCLIVCPATLTQQWVSEFHRWWPPLRIINLHLTKLDKVKVTDSSGRRISKRAKKSTQVANFIEPFFKRGHIFIVSYEGLLNYGPRFARQRWGCIILDEGHKISNPDTLVSKAAKLFETPYRYILSGTPIQNKLKELWAIYDFIRPGLLGTQEEFDKRIAKSIELTGSKGKDIYEKQLAVACARNLRSVIKNNLLRRLKLEVALELPKKTEQVLYCPLHPHQRRMYIKYLDSQECQRILDDKMNHMVGITALRKICNHPDLVYFNKHLSTHKYGHYELSGKTRVLDGLLNMWKEQNHRVLIFCQTVQTQEILERMSFFEKNRFFSMNGKTPVANRMELVDRFNIDKSVFAFMLTTRTGGQGLNLTGADRVVIFDPDWNPSADLQALSRAWRLGQSKEVTIYRLLTSGTIEERVHHLQLYKQLLADRILKDPQQKLLFRNHNNDLFAYPPEENDTSLEPTEDNLNDPPLTSMEEAQKALSVAVSYGPESNEEPEVIDKPDSELQGMLDLIGVGNESALELDKQQKIPKDSVTQKLDRMAVGKLQGLNASWNPNETNFKFKNKGLPDLPEGAFHKKRKPSQGSSSSAAICNLEKMQRKPIPLNTNQMNTNSSSGYLCNLEKMQKTPGLSTSNQMNSNSGYLCNIEKMQRPINSVNQTNFYSSNSSNTGVFNKNPSNNFQERAISNRDPNIIYNQVTKGPSSTPLLNAIKRNEVHPLHLLSRPTRPPAPRPKSHLSSIFKTPALNRTTQSFSAPRGLSSSPFQNSNSFNAHRPTYRPRPTPPSLINNSPTMNSNNRPRPPFLSKSDPKLTKFFQKRTF